MKLFKIRADQEVAKKGPEGSGVRRRTVKLQNGGTFTLTVGAKPIFLECDELPAEIAADSHLIAQEVDSAGPDGVVVNLKSERVQEDLVDPGGTSWPDISRLKSERVQEDLIEPGVVEPELKSERVQEELAAAPAEPSVPPSVSVPNPKPKPNPPKRRR